MSDVGAWFSNPRLVNCFAKVQNKYSESFEIRLIISQGNEQNSRYLYDS
jgi:hypothetical protein